LRWLSCHFPLTGCSFSCRHCSVVSATGHFR
jgi:hypothetical protein